jgi:hypothetical protein
MAINVAATPFVVALQLKQVVLTHTPPGVRNPDLDGTFPGAYYDALVPTITLTLLGNWLNTAPTFTALTLTLTLDADWAPSAMLNVDAHIDLTMELSGDFSTELSRRNWVKWSNIGNLDFTIGRDNVAGERPMFWQGWVYAIKKLGKSVIVYGEQGVALLNPSGYNWGMATVSGIGVQSKLAVCGNETVHYFVDIHSRLCRMMEKLEILGYDEFLSTMSDIVLSYDETLGRVYICDGMDGYVYSERDKSLGRGPGNITGIALDLVTSAGAIDDIPFEICTDIYDLGTRKDKTIMDVDFGFYSANPVWAAVDWRKDKSEAFATTPWTRVNPNGKAVLPCWGREFRFRLKMYIYDADFKLDYFKVNGVLHNYSFLDSFLRGRQV